MKRLQFSKGFERNILIIFSIWILLAMDVLDAGCSVPMCSCHKVTAVCTNNGANLTYIPRFLPQRIQKLNFSSNYLPNVSSQTFNNISHLKLTDLYLTDDKIEYIGNGAFEMLPFIKILDLSWNPIATQILCSSFFGLRNANLTQLFLNGLRITSIPGDCLENLGKLQRIYLKQNALVEFESTPLVSLKELNVIDVSSNGLKRINLNGLYNLIELWASNNSLSFVPDLQDHAGECLCPNMDRMDLSRNHLEELGPSMFPPTCTTNLRKIFFDNNKLVKTIRSNTFAGLQAILYVSLSYLSSLDNIELDAFRSRTLQVLFFRNSINFNRRGFASVKDLFKTCPRLLKLDLLGNRLSGLREDTITDMLSPLTKLVSLGLQKTNMHKLSPNLFYNKSQLAILNLKNNEISSWDPQVFANVTTLKTLFIDRNKITLINETSFPKALRVSLSKFDAEYNPFACTCELVWFTKWMHQMKRSRKNLPFYPKNYVCHYPNEQKGKLMIHYNPTYAECHPTSPYLILGIVLGVVTLVTAVAATVIYKYRWHMKYWIYLARSRKGYQKIDGDEFVYDAFVAYNGANRNWVITEMMPFLEEQEDMKLCFHDRDFDGGRLIVDNIVTKMKESRKIILVLSNDFVRSQWCHFEMVMAQELIFENGTDTLIILMLEEVSARHMTGVLHMLMKSTTYITWTAEKVGQDLFWDKLCKALKGPCQHQEYIT